MPTFVRIALIITISLCANVSWSQEDDRYADRHSENQDQAESEIIDDSPADTAEPSASPPADWQDAPRPLRKLPFRFEPAPAGYAQSQVIRASANETVDDETSLLLETKPLSLKRPAKSASEKRTASSTMPSVPTLLGSVAMVAGLFIVVAWVAKRGLPKRPPLLPREALEVLGRQRFGAKQELQLIRVGNKLVLLHVAAGHLESLAEVTDPEEVDRLTGICYQAHPHSSSRGFQQTLQQYSQEGSSKRRTARPAVDKLDLSMFDGLGRDSTRTK